MLDAVADRITMPPHLYAPKSSGWCARVAEDVGTLQKNLSVPPWPDGLSMWSTEPWAGFAWCVREAVEGERISHCRTTTRRTAVFGIRCPLCQHH